MHRESCAVYSTRSFSLSSSIFKCNTQEGSRAQETSNRSRHCIASASPRNQSSRIEPCENGGAFSKKDPVDCEGYITFQPLLSSYQPIIVHRFSSEKKLTMRKCLCGSGFAFAFRIDLPAFKCQCLFPRLTNPLVSLCKPKYTLLRYYIR